MTNNRVLEEEVGIKGFLFDFPGIGGEIKTSPEDFIVREILPDGLVITDGSEIGNDIGLTERTAHKIIIDLEEAGYITRKKVGRRNTYMIHPDIPIRDSVATASVGELLTTLGCKNKKR